MKNPIRHFHFLQYLISFLIFGLVYMMVNSCTSKPPEGSRATQATAGKAHFMQYCASCHGEDGKGLQIDSLERQPADLTAIMKGRTSSEFPILEVANMIDGRKMAKTHGSRDMPVWGEVFSKQEYMSEDEIKGKLAELIAYLMVIQKD